MLIKYSEKFNNQLFISSHSIEFADSFLNSVYGENSEFNFDEENDPIRFYTMRPPSESTNFQTEVWSYTGLEAYKKRQDFDLELR